MSSTILLTILSSLFMIAIANRVRTCDVGSPAYGLPMCNTSLSWKVRVDDLVGRLEKTEKIEMIQKLAYPTSFINRLNIKSFYWDMTCSHGVATLYGLMPTSSYVTVFPVPIAQAATWNTDIVFQIAKATADEARVVNQIELQNSDGTNNYYIICNGGPVVNIVHDPRWGRISETYGEDPFLLSTMGVTFTQGLQGNFGTPYIETASVTRHIIAYSGPEGFNNSERFSFNAVMNAHDLEDSLYPGFEACQEDGKAEGIMCSYSALNGIPSCLNALLLKKKLRTDWKSDAYVVSDWGAIELAYSAQNYSSSVENAIADSIYAGMQLIYTASDLTQEIAQGIENGDISESEIDQIVSRSFMTRMKLGEFDPIENNPYANISLSVLNSQEHQLLARKSAAESIVLLKNAKETLPLNLFDIKALAVIGPNANPDPTTYLHSYYGKPPYVVSIWQGIQDAALEFGIQAYFAQGCDVLCTSYADFDQAIHLARKAEVTVLVVGLNSEVAAEGLDRHNLSLPGSQLDLILVLREYAQKLVLVLVNDSPVSINDTLADAILEVWYGGQEAGNAVADVLFGKENPAGRLPLTYFSDDNTLPPITNYDFTQYPGRTYRYFQQEPTYYFGYGLSYTLFNYTELSIDPEVIDDDEQNITVTVTVKNNGELDGNEVSQLYITVPPLSNYPTPRVSLQGFSKNFLVAGESKTLSFVLTQEQISTVAATGVRRVTKGTYTVYVGGHQPADTKGEQNGNVVAGSFQVQ